MAVKIEESWQLDGLISQMRKQSQSPRLVRARARL